MINIDLTNALQLASASGAHNVTKWLSGASIIRQSFETGNSIRMYGFSAVYGMTGLSVACKKNDDEGNGDYYH